MHRSRPRGVDRDGSDGAGDGAGRGYGHVSGPLGRSDPYSTPEFGRHRARQADRRRAASPAVGVDPRIAGRDAASGDLDALAAGIVTHPDPGVSRRDASVHADRDGAAAACACVDRVAARDDPLTGGGLGEGDSRAVGLREHEARRVAFDRRLGIERDVQRCVPARAEFLRKPDRRSAAADEHAAAFRWNFDASVDEEPDQIELLALRRVFENVDDFLVSERKPRRADGGERVGVRPALDADHALDRLGAVHGQRGGEPVLVDRQGDNIDHATRCAAGDQNRIEPAASGEIALRQHVRIHDNGAIADDVACDLQEVARPVSAHVERAVECQIEGLPLVSGFHILPDPVFRERHGALECQGRLFADFNDFPVARSPVRDVDIADIQHKPVSPASGDVLIPFGAPVESRASDCKVVEGSGFEVDRIVAATKIHAADDRRTLAHEDSRVGGVLPERMRVRRPDARAAFEGDGDPAAGARLRYDGRVLVAGGGTPDAPRNRDRDESVIEVSGPAESDVAVVLDVDPPGPAVDFAT